MSDISHFERDAQANDHQAKLTAAEARLAHLEAELARWKVCSLCGETMAEPGACSSAERERKEGYESMYEEAMDRAEAAEAKLASLEASHHALTEKLKALVEQWRSESSNREPGIGSGMEICADKLSKLISQDVVVRGL